MLLNTFHQPRRRRRRQKQPHQQPQPLIDQLRRQIQKPQPTQRHRFLQFHPQKHCQPHLPLTMEVVEMVGVKIRMGIIPPSIPQCWETIVYQNLEILET